MTTDADALAPVRAALLEAARREADEIRAGSATAAAETLASARAQADRITAAARERGAADARATEDADRAKAQRIAHAGVLEAGGAAYAALLAAARPAVEALREEPTYPALRRRIVGAVRRLLGPGASLRDAPGGGVVGEAAGRRVDYSLTDLVDRAVAGALADVADRDSSGAAQEPRHG